METTVSSLSKVIEESVANLESINEGVYETQQNGEKKIVELSQKSTELVQKNGQSQAKVVLRMQLAVHCLEVQELLNYTESQQIMKQLQQQEHLLQQKV